MAFIRVGSELKLISNQTRALISHAVFSAVYSSLLPHQTSALSSLPLLHCRLFEDYFRCHGALNSDVPNSDVPSPDVLSSDVPSSDVPSSDVPSSDVPNSDVLSSDVPSSDVPSPDVPKRDYPINSFRLD